MPLPDDFLGDDSIAFPEIAELDPDANMPRWIIASARYFFYQNFHHKMFFEHLGQNSLTSPTGKSYERYAEFRLDGPYKRQFTKRDMYYDIEINVLCISNVNSGKADPIEVLLGNLLSIFSIGHFDVRRYGRTDMDDDSLIGCMRLQTGHNEEIRVSRFGQANQNTRVTQASVEGHYQMRLF